MNIDVAIMNIYITITNAIPIWEFNVAAIHIM
jgi:hypothetical protein